MADGQVEIAVIVDGKQIAVLNKDLDNVGKTGQKASSGLKTIATSLGLVKVASAALNVMKQSLDAAIDRFDTMKKFPKVMSALGFSTDESTASINKLSDGIEGLPTKLNDVVAQTQQLTAITGDLSKSTDTVLALNNAFLASGASAEDASRGMVQYNQMLSKGTVDMQSWRSLQETMPLALQKTAEAMGFVGQTAQLDLYNALKEGDRTFEEFNNALIELGTGTGELAKLAKINSEGISTSFSNLRNAAVKGLANVLEALDDLSKAATGKSIAKNLDGLKSGVNTTFKFITSTIKASTPVVSLFVSTLGTTIDVVKPLSPALVGLAAAYASLKIIQTVSSFMSNQNTLLDAALSSGKNMVIVTKAQMEAEVAKIGVQKVGMAATAANNGMLTLSNVLYGVLTGSISASAAATAIMTAATSALSAAITFLTGPIGWIVGGIAALTTALVINNKKSKEAKEKVEQEVKAYKDLNDSIKNSRVEREKNIKNLETESAISDSLIDSLAGLYAQTDLTKAKKADLMDIVDQLNGKFTDLNLVYNEETGYLNQSIDLIRQKTEAYEAQSKVTAYNDAITENMKEQIQLESQSIALKQSIAELEEQLSGRSTENRRENNIALKEQQAALQETHEQEKVNASEYEILMQGRQDALNNYAQAEANATTAIQEANAYTTLSYDMLNEAQKTAMDSMRQQYQSLTEAATNSYDVINTKSELSVAQMTENMAQNQEIISQWATNIDTLAKKGLDEGLLQQLREAGPESAAQVAALVGASDEEFQRFNEVASNAGNTGITAFKTAFDVGSQEIPDSVMKIVTSAKETLNTQMSAANFQEFGKNVSDGASSGIDQNSGKAGDASEKLAQKVTDRFKAPLGINSPSKLFNQFGGYLIQGLVQGVNNGNGLVNSAVNKLTMTIINGMKKTVVISRQTSTQIPQAFAGLPNQMASIGSQAMNGLASGIRGNSGAALSAAANVASQITATMKKAMEIHSPSRIMRDEVGRFIPEGVAVGIDKYANKAYMAMSSLSKGLMKPISPEIAAGANHLGGLTGASQIINNNYAYSQSNDEGKYIIVKSEVNLDGHKIAEGTNKYHKAINMRADRASARSVGRR